MVLVIKSMTLVMKLLTKRSSSVKLFSGDHALQGIRRNVVHKVHHALYLMVVIIIIIIIIIFFRMFIIDDSCR